MSNKEARAVLIKAREEILRELTVCGQAGGTGRASAYAPQLVSIQGAIEALDRISAASPVVLVTQAERMASVRAAKAAQ
jgi:hypothetical protein